MKYNKNIIIGFSVVIFLMILSNIFIFYKLIETSQDTKKLYEHPFQVSNAVRSIESNVYAMHRHMKDVVLAQNTKQLIDAIRAVDVYEKDALESYRIIYRQYLGEKKDIDISFETFVSWKEIRQEVIDLMQKGNVSAAAEITKGKGAKHIEKLYTQIQKLLDYANNKADSFYKNSQDKKSLTLITIIIFSFLVLLISVTMAYYIITDYKIVTKDTNKYLHIIDQNIMLAEFDLNHKVIDVTQELARSFDLVKKDMLGSKTNFFIEDDNFEKFDELIKTITSGKEYKIQISKDINSQTKWYEMTIIPQFDNDYIISSYRAILIDISYRKLLEINSIEDGLTKLYNRNYFDKIFPNEINRAKREGQSLSVLIIDIDNFKLYNDTYGHFKGDLALKSVARAILNVAQRSSDYAFRLGGEEFIILYHTKTYEQSVDFAAQIRQSVLELKIEHKKNDAMKVLTVSSGMMFFNTPDRFDSKEMLIAVDKLLYEAKAKGKNQVVSKTDKF